MKLQFINYMVLKWLYKKSSLTDVIHFTESLFINETKIKKFKFENFHTLGKI
jgi:hypothetical protein